MRDDLWPEEKISTLRQLWAEGLAGSEIGRRMGVTKSAVIGKAHRLGLESRLSPISRSNCGLGKAKKPYIPRASKSTLPGLTLDATARSKGQQWAMPAAKPKQPEAGVAYSGAVPVRALKPGKCRFPLWGRGRPTHQYCDKPATQFRDGRPSSYCPVHHARCWVAPVKPNLAGLEQAA